MLNQLKQLKYSCIIEPYIQNERWDDLLNIFEDIYSEIDKEDQKAPYLSLVATIMMNLPQSHKNQISETKIHKIKHDIDELPDATKNIIKPLMQDKCTIEDIRNHIDTIQSCTNIDDLIRSFKSVKILASNNMSHAFDNQDLDFFLLAAELESDFIIGEKIKCIPSSTRRDILMEEIAKNSSNHQNSEELQKLYIKERIEYTPPHDGKYLLDISFDNIKSILADDEAVLIFIINDIHELLYLYTSNSNTKLNKVALSHNIICSWHTLRKSVADEDTSSKINTLSELIPMFNDIDNSIKRVYIVPPVQYFGFPFEFIAPLERYYSINVLPSLSWFLLHRRKSNTSEGKSAWLGSIESPDETIDFFRSNMVDDLISQNFAFCDDLVPNKCNDKSIVIIASHGDFLQSMRLSDGVTMFTSEKFSHFFRNTKLVVLICCNAGTGNYNTHWHAIDSLAEQLLSQNVSCVIAPTFSINAGTAIDWLKKFFIYYNQYSVAHSALMATQFLRYNNQHKCCWGNLHVYGDGNFVI